MAARKELFSNYLLIFLFVLIIFIGSIFIMSLLHSEESVTYVNTLLTVFSVMNAMSNIWQTCYVKTYLLICKYTSLLYMFPLRGENISTFPLGQLDTT